MMFHSRISEESAAQIIAELCAKTSDEESMARQVTLTATYRKRLRLRRDRRRS